MCIVSPIIDYGQRMWPIEPLRLGLITITPEQWAEYVKLKQAAEEFDKKTGQPDCIDPKKKEWEDEVRRLIREEIGK